VTTAVYLGVKDLSTIENVNPAAYERLTRRVQKVAHRSALERIAVALGAATVSLLFMIGPLVSPDHLTLYHLDGPAAPIFVPVALDVCLLWLVFWIVLTFAAKAAWLHNVLWAGIILLFPWILFKNCTRLGNWVSPEWISLMVLFLPSIVFVAAGCIFRGSRRSIFAVVQSFAARLLAFVALVGVAALVQLLWFAYQARNLDATAAPLHHSQISVESFKRTRVIWILLDELSYQQVFERRYPGMALPAFDHFAATATIFTEVIPAGMYTDVAVPSLFTGLPVDRLRVSAQGNLESLDDSGSDRWNPFDAHQTVFQDALSRGYSTGIVGWYNPYCRILPEVLDRCFWTFRRTHPGGMVSDQSLESNLIDPIRHLPGDALFSLSKLTDQLPRRPMPMDQIREAQIHIHDYQDLFREADSLLADPQVNFAFLHMPVPHPRGIYDRRLMKFSTGPSSYLDNLVLADQYLAHVRSVLTQQGRWDSSVVIVMGDHSWRTALMWAKSPEWTKEEQAASHGAQFDARPVYMIKMPGQNAGSRIDAPFSAIHTRSLLDAVFSDRLHNADGLQSWAARQH
jgi:hypothetical protein